MPSGALAAVIASLFLAFVEALARIYPARETWWRLRRERGRPAVRAMRERFEATAGMRAPRVLAGVLLAMVVVWVGLGSVFDKRWHEIVLDVVPYLIVSAALLRMPSALGAVGKRMKDYERQAGDDPDSRRRREEGGNGAIAL
jgi:hypothetical protein